MSGEKLKKFTDNLLKVYNYAFTEETTYGFYKPNEAMYQAVRMTAKEYHCLCCGKHFQVRIRNDNDGILYFSKSRIAAQKKLWSELELDFPDEAALEQEPFVYQIIGYCADCAADKLAEKADAGQQINNLCHRLYLQDIMVADKAKQYMTEAVERWLKGISDAGELTKFDITNPAILQELIWIMVLSDTEKCQQALAEYKTARESLQQGLDELLQEATPAWKGYAARSTSLPESMSDGEYHEYTLAFPADDTQGQDFYLQRQVLKERAEMFVRQPRIDTLEDLLGDAGFQEKWLDMVLDKVNDLTKRQGM